MHVRPTYGSRLKERAQLGLFLFSAKITTPIMERWGSLMRVNEVSTLDPSLLAFLNYTKGVEKNEQFVTFYPKVYES